MKKSLLIIAAVATSMAASAQTKWLQGVTAGAAADAGAIYQAKGEALDGVAESSDYVVKAVEIGAGLEFPADAAKACAKNEKFGNDGYVPYFQPTIAEGEGKIFDDADKTAYVTFYEETNESGSLEVINVNSIEFKAARIGTDAVRMKAFLQVLDAGGDVAWEQDLITAENAASVLTNGVYTQQYEVTDAESGTTSLSGFDGFQPARNKDGVYFKDGDQGGDGTAQTENMWYTQVSVPVPADFPEDAWNAQLKVYIYGIHNNKQGVIYDVKFNHGTSAIAGVAEAKVKAAAPAKVITAKGVQIGKFNVAGQQVK